MHCLHALLIRLFKRNNDKSTPTTPFVVSITVWFLSHEFRCDPGIITNRVSNADWAHRPKFVRSCVCPIHHIRKTGTHFRQVQLLSEIRWPWFLFYVEQNHIHKKMSTLLGWFRRIEASDSWKMAFWHTVSQVKFDMFFFINNSLNMHLKPTPRPEPE